MSYDLELVAGQFYDRGFGWEVDGVRRDLSGYSWRAQIRQKESVQADLVLELTEHMDLDPQDPTTINLSLSAFVTRGMPKLRATASWDFFIWPTGQPERAELLLEGTVTMNPATTDPNSGL